MSVPRTSVISRYGRRLIRLTNPGRYAGGSGTSSLSRFVFVHFLLLSEKP